MTKNRVVAGDYNNFEVIFYFGTMYFIRGLKKISVTKNVVSSWSLVHNVGTHSVWGPIVGAGIGGLIFGPVGAMSGAAIVGGRSNKSYFVSLEFVSGKKSLVQLDETSYNQLIKYLY